MNNITDVNVINGFIKMCNDGYDLGWHERNGGNLTYRMKKEEVEECKKFFLKTPKDWVKLRIQAPNLAGEYFMATGSGKFFRNVILEPQNSFCIAEINKSGDSYRIVWGLENGGVPTSEFESHLMNHSVKKELSNDSYRVIYHSHTPNVIAMTFILPINNREFSRVLWKMETECPVVFPGGVGIVRWMVPGGPEIAKETCKLMEDFDAVIWAHHGIFCAGPDFDTTFGLMHTIEKSAEIYMKVIGSGKPVLQTISDDDIRAIGKVFKVEIREDFLD